MQPKDLIKDPSIIVLKEDENEPESSIIRSLASILAPSLAQVPIYK